VEAKAVVGLSVKKENEEEEERRVGGNIKNEEGKKTERLTMMRIRIG
jgi:hypothetical protein